MFSRAHLFGAYFAAWTFGFRRYLSKPTFADNIINENGVTLILENDVARQAARPAVWNRIVDGDGSTTIDFVSIIGTLYGYMNHGAGWVYEPVSTGLSGAILTTQVGTKYKYFKDNEKTFVMETGQGTVQKSNDGLHTASLSGSSIWDTDNTVKLQPESGDVLGIIKSDQGEYPIASGTGGLTGTTIWTGRKDEPLTINEIPHISLDESLGDSLSIDVGVLDLATVTITEARGVRHGTTTKLVPSDFVLNTVTNEIEVASGLVVDVNYFKFSDLSEATYMGGEDASGNVLGSANFRINSSVGAGTFTVNVGDVDTATVLVDSAYAPEVEFGSSRNRIWFNSSRYNVSDFTAVGFGASVTTYRDTLATNKFQYAVPNDFVSGSPLKFNGEEAGLRSTYILMLTDGHSAALNKLSLFGTINNARYYFDFETSTNGRFNISIYDTYLHDTLNALLPTLSDPSTDLQKIAPFNFYSLDSIMAWWVNNPSLRFNVDDLLNEYVTGLTYEVFYDYYAANSIGTSSFDTYDGLILVFSANYNGARQQINGNSFKDNGQNVGGGNTLTGRIYWYSNNISLKYLTFNAPVSRITGTSIEWVKVYDGFIITEEVLPLHNGLDVLFGLAAENPTGNHLDIGTKIALPPQRTITEQEIGNLTGAFDFHRDKGDDTYDRLLISAYDKDPLSTDQTNKATAYTS